MQKIHFYTSGKNPGLKNKKKLRLFIEQLFTTEKTTFLNLTYIFCTDKQLLKINSTFLKHDYYTDVITFNLGAIPKEIIGEIYISIDRIKENAKIENCTFKEELHRVIFHGALHLCGYKDKRPGDAKKMRQAENLYLNAYFK